jgi:hypothetical protein
MMNVPALNGIQQQHCSNLIVKGEEKRERRGFRSTAAPEPSDNNIQLKSAA